MARPHKTGLEYFNMDCGFEQDPKIERLDFKYGNDGIAIFTRILARVYATGGRFTITEADMDIYASKFKVSYERLNEILSYMREINLFPTENFLSNSVKKRIKKIQQERIRKRQNRSKHHKNKEVAEVVIDGYNPAITTEHPPKVKERKVKESKVKREKHLFTHSPYYEEKDFIAKFNENPKYRKYDARHYYEQVKNWSGANSEKKADWILTAYNWARSDKNPKLIEIKEWK